MAEEFLLHATIDEITIQKIVDGVVSKLAVIQDQERKDNAIKDELMSCDQVCTYLGISQGTRHLWTNKGILNKYLIGGKVKYKRMEIITQLKMMEQKKHK